MAPGLTFFTGFPGFLGKRLVAAMLADDPELRIAALVEPKLMDQARRVASELDAGRIELLDGDIGKRDLGLESAQLERLRAEVTCAYHLAAIYNLAVPLATAQVVNVEGTGNVLDLCAACERLERLNYVSTAYVAGTRHGVVYEHELSLGQSFKNHYESTKFQAELWVRSRMDSVPTTIYRPAIVVGDSRSGETQKFDGPYYLLRLISQSVARGAPIGQFGASSAPFNVVPVDYVVGAMRALASDSRALGETLHLVDPEPITAHELLTLLSREYARRRPSYRVPPALVENALRLRSVRGLFSDTPRESIRYLNHAVSFDTRRADDLLAGHNLRCPRFEEYVGPIVSFFREHEHESDFAPAAL